MLSQIALWVGPIGAFLLIIAKAVSEHKTAAPEPIVPADPPIPEALPAPVSSVVPEPEDGLTPRGEAELVHHEALVLEAYKDSQGIWTWGVGVTDASGHTVERYIDHPALISECLSVFVWLLRQKYLPTVLKAFAGVTLSETQLAAALSFHYNTGAILHASWVDHWRAGDIAGAKILFMQWDKPASVTERRQDECDLFFDGKWAGDGTCMVYPVLKPSYQPDFHHGVRLYVLETLKGA